MCEWRRPLAPDSLTRVWRQVSLSSLRQPVPASDARPASEEAAATRASSDEPVTKKARLAAEVSAAAPLPLAPLTRVAVQANGEVKEKQTPKKKVSQLERTRAEAEALIGDLKKDGEESGGRRTRSQTRGTPAKSPVLSEKPTRAPRTSKPTPAPAPKKSPATAKSRSRAPAKAAAAGEDAGPAAEAPAAVAAPAAATDKSQEGAKQESKTEEAGDKEVLENGDKSAESKGEGASVEEKETAAEGEEAKGGSEEKKSAEAVAATSA